MIVDSDCVDQVEGTYVHDVIIHIHNPTLKISQILIVHNHSHMILKGIIIFLLS
jgi:hypothetical protein